MSYTPTTWVDGETPVNAENLNKLEQAVQENDTAIEEINTARENGEFKGDTGNPGVYTLAEGETIDDAPEWAQVVVDPYTDPPAVEMVVTFADGTTATYNLYGEAVTA